MSYKLIIADDEEKIIDLIKMLGHWKEYDIEVVDTCQNGRIAYESICNNRPDIVLVDIKMPVYDGLTLLQKVREKGINAVFIVISGYRHFEYARNAIALGVMDYLLKPLDEAQLNENLMRACEKVRLMRQERQKDDQLDRMLSERREEKENRLWGHLLSFLKNGDYQQAQTAIVGAEYEFPYDMLTCGVIHSGIDALVSRDDILTRREMNACCSKVFGTETVTCYISTSHGKYIILNTNNKDENKVEHFLFMLRDILLRMQEAYGEYPVYIGYSTGQASEQNIQKLMLEAEIASLSGMSMRRKQAVNFQDILSIPRIRHNRFLSGEEWMALRKYVKNCNFEETGKLFRKVVSRCAASEEVSPIDLWEFIQMIQKELFPYVLKNESEEWKDNLQAVYMQADGFDQAVKMIYLELIKYMEVYYERHKEKENQPIQDARDYIHRNYQRAISLDEVAEQVGLSTAYFSSLFKENVGTGFQEYLSQLRMDEAKELLVKTNLSVKVIAERVGYIDDKHFFRTFKKRIGITPAEYRTIYHR